MPQIQRQDLPRALFQHLLDRVQSRNVSPDQLGALARWLDTQPEVPIGKWFKRFTGFTVCGEGMLIKTFLQAGQVPVGTDLNAKS